MLDNCCFPNIGSEDAQAIFAGAADSPTYAFVWAWHETARNWTLASQGPTRGNPESLAREGLAKSTSPAGGIRAGEVQVYAKGTQGWQWLGTTRVTVWGWSTGGETERVTNYWGGIVQ